MFQSPRREGENILINESRLLENLKKQRRGTLEKVIALYTPYVSAVVYNVIGAVMPKEDIEEAVSDVFLSLWRNAQTLDGEKGSLRAYLGAAARNTAKNKLRSYRPCAEIDDDVISERSEPTEAVEEREERQRLIDVITSLGEPDSEIFFRYYYHEEKISRIADVTGLRASTVKSRLARGRNKLKAILREKEVRQ